MRATTAPRTTLTPDRVRQLVRQHGGTALVLDGEVEYHAEACAAVAGRDVLEDDVRALLADGFVPCRRCRPDHGLALAALVALRRAPRVRVPAPRSEAVVLPPVKGVVIPRLPRLDVLPTPPR